MSNNNKLLLNDFAVCILTFGRSEKVYTYNTLRRQGYTGRIFLFCSIDDEQLPEYQKKYGNEVVVFDKKDIVKRMDIMDNLDEWRCGVFARNAMMEMAPTLGIRYMCQIDDDMTAIYWSKDSQGNVSRTKVSDLDSIFCSVIKYYKKSGAMAISFSQGGDLLGGSANPVFTQNKVRHKTMNTWFVSTDRPLVWNGRMNDDILTSTIGNYRGQLFICLPNLYIVQTVTQQDSGGMTELYQAFGTYAKSMYLFIAAPSAIHVTFLSVMKRVHHKLVNKYSFVRVIREEFKK